MYNVALIGYGYWGSKLERYIKENPFFNLRCICNSKFNLNEIWKDKNIDSVVVATPQETHYEVVREALLCNKNVLSEKPLTLLGSEAKELRKLAFNKNRVLVVDYTYTFSQGLQRAKQLVDEGVIGKILSFQLSMKRFGRFGRGHVYWLLGSHMLSVLDMFCQIEELEYINTEMVSSKSGVETGYILFHNTSLHNTSQIGEISVSLNYPGKETMAILYGELGSIAYNELSQPTLLIKRYENDDNSFENLDFDESNNLQYTMDYFVDVLQGKQKGNIDRAVEISDILCNCILSGGSSPKFSSFSSIDSLFIERKTIHE